MPTSTQFLMSRVTAKWSALHSVVGDSATGVAPTCRCGITSSSAGGGLARSPQFQPPALHHFSNTRLLWIMLEQH